MKNHIMIIPHSGIQYGGFARKKLFLELKKKERDQIFKIIYISAYHNKLNEHSYEWVKTELYEYFPYSEHIVYQPKNWNESKYLSKKINIDKNTLLIGTTDLMHYGEKFNNKDTKKMNRSQRRKWKENKEKKIIQTFLKPNSKIMKKIYLKENNICGPYSIYTILLVIEKHYSKLRGKQLSYYDSLDRRYVKNIKNDSQSIFLNDFVSYISIIYQ